MKHELIIVLDFGGQYNQLIARRVRDLNVYCEVLSYDAPIEEIKNKNPKGIIFTGGPSVVTEEDAPIVDKEIFNLGIPVFGICYGCQLMGYLNGGQVGKADKKEYGKAELTVNNQNPLFKNIDKDSICWMSHTYYITEVPPNFEVIGTTETCPLLVFIIRIKIFMVYNSTQKSYTHNLEMI